jgi:hypothetical protein
MGSIEPGSFRDPSSRVYIADDAVYRLLSSDGVAEWRALADSEMFATLTGDRRLVNTEEVDPAELDGVANLEDALVAGVAGALRHERIPFVSYPYEWSFGMLRDAAVLQLDLLLAALDEDMILKDATPYNVQWRGSDPVFVDVGSFERLREGEPWAGYRQFCELFLYPLLLQAYRGVPFQPLLRGSLDGISPSDADRLFTLRDHFRRGVLTHVHLHARLERRYAKRAGGDVKRELRGASFRPELIRANARKLRRLVSGLRWLPRPSAWTGYREACSYTEADTALKRSFVVDAIERLAPDRAWDLGSNDGSFARIAAERGAYVIAFDSDHASVDALYGKLREEGSRSILPLVADLTNPSPGLGWRGRERQALLDRGAPDLVLCLALVHHLAIAGNLPIAEIVDWLRSLAAPVVVELPHRDDPMVQRLLSGKAANANPDYERERFERHLTDSFRIERREELPSGLRTVYLALPG